MKFWGVFRFEFGYQLRRPWPWLFFAVLLVVSFLVARDFSLADALYEDFFANAPFAIAKTTVVGGLVWLLLAPAIAGEAAARDVGTRMYPLLYTTSLSKIDYLGGRFVAALAINALLLSAVQLGIMLGVYSPGVDPVVIGPFRPMGYVTCFAFIAVPNAIVATAIQFVLALRTGRAMAGYLGSLFLIFMGFFVASFLLYKQGFGALVDPIGIRFVIDDLAHTWTTVERNTRVIGLEGIVLTNRLFWMGIAVSVGALTFVRFRFAHRAEGSAWWRRRASRAVRAAVPSAAHAAAGAAIQMPDAPRITGAALQLRQTLAIAGSSFRSLALSWAGLALLVAIPVLTIAVVLDQMTSASVPLLPTTARVLAEMTASLSDQLSRWVIVPLVIVFFAGELVWREREAGLGEISDAMPGSDWAPLVGKFLGLGLVLVLFLGMLAAAGVMAQSIRGYEQFEPGLYLQVLLGLQLPEYLLFALLALAIHVVVNQKYVAHLVAIMMYVFIVVLADLLGIEHNLLVYGAGPQWTYTGMRGFSGTIEPWLWFKLYWAGWALFIAVVSRVLWVRGRESGLRIRMELARRRFAGPTAATAAVAMLFIAAVGGFIVYNTNVLNEYRSSARIAERSAEYERRYQRYATMSQPQIASTTLHVEIYPDSGTAEIRGSYRLVNGGNRAIDSILVSTAGGGVETRALTLNRPSVLAHDDLEFGQRIYALRSPLQPGDSLTLEFDVRAAPRGFRESGAAEAVSAHGSFVNNASLPSVGYQDGRELITASDRRAHGLEARPVIASLKDDAADASAPRGRGTMFHAIVGTAGNQTAVAPGNLVRSWTERGRRYFEYATSAPIGDEWAFFSAEYATRAIQWHGVAIRIFHNPRHTAHLERITKAIEASLAYYSERLGAYPYSHLTVVERAGAPGTGMHADASMITYGEGFPEWIPEPGSLDFPYAVVAHEMAHQWTVPYAAVEGAPFLSEGLAWYSAMGVVGASRGEAERKSLLSRMRQPYPYPPIRRGEPLLRALDPYLSYRRGPFALVALQEYIGADGVNLALRRFIARHDSVGVPPATTLGLYRELQAVTPDSLRPLLHDLFEVNTLWEFETTAVRADSMANGAWQVTLDVRARKIVYDSAGLETEVPVNDWVEIAVFAEAKGGSELSAPVYVGKHRIRSGKQTVTVTVPRKPLLAGIDPFHLLDWVEDGDDDNIDMVRITSRGRP